MSCRMFKPVILFHDHSYSSDPSSGVTHRIHIPYGDPYYTPLIQKKKHKVGLMLKSNGRAWYDIIQHSRSPFTRSPDMPILLNKPSRVKQVLREPTVESDNNSIISTCSSSSSCSSSNSDSSSSTPIPTTLITRKRRGNLPKIVTAVLKQWLIDHCRNPYPTEVEKTCLKDKTGLTLNQISNWFINARRRLLPQILDTLHPHHTEMHHISSNTEQTPKKRKRSRMSYFYNKGKVFPTFIS
ncbi:uncharacterized protein EV154DRAFT_522850 [Mucor mucedo]|uniref:uncharacterized protein n=1 Tax=Mucor mucedo TaxID=29922 RepID=UPI002220635C|nr:uncharacterized protein EV154DRAFT_522850 [Mucor mucedo]KAI7882806.1 hypothetical protein EV154DRAFT_522850 [Mucor mucedo]